MIGDSVVGQAAVHEAQASLLPFGVQRDLHGGRTRRDRVTRLVPSEAEDDLLERHDFDELARGLVLPPNEHAVHTAWARIELGLGAVPLDVTLGLGEERPHGLGTGVDHDLSHELGHHALPFSSCAASATSRSRSSPLVQ